MTYTEEQITGALAILASVGGDLKAASKRTGIDVETLAKWQALQPEQDVAHVLEAAIRRMLANMPETWNSRDWAPSLALLIDKFLILATHDRVTESVLANELGAMSEARRREIIDEANKILGTRSGG